MKNPTWHLTFAPSVTWTYCQSLCGSGEQAADFENALENANADMINGVG